MDICTVLPVTEQQVFEQKPAPDAEPSVEPTKPNSQIEPESRAPRVPLECPKCPECPTIPKIECEGSRNFMLTVMYALICLPGGMALVLWIASVIFQNTKDFGGSEAFVFTVGWPFLIILPLTILCCIRKVNDPVKCGPVVVWRSTFHFFVSTAIIAFIVSIVGAVRLVPYVYLQNNVAYTNYSSTPLHKDSVGFVWSDAILGTKHTATYLTNNVQVEFCVDCGNDCEECDNVNVAIKYCMVPVLPINGTYNITQINGIAVCFWFPCRQQAYWEASPHSWISEHVWDSQCFSGPSLSDCLYECGPQYGTNGLTVLNGVKLVGKKWLSKYTWGTTFRREDASPTYKYGVTFDQLYAPMDGNLTAMIEQSLGVPVLRSSTGEILMIEWGDEPFVYYSSGFVVFVGVTWGAIVLFLPPSPLCITKSVYILPYLCCWVILTVIPYTLFYIYVKFPTDT